MKPKSIIYLVLAVLFTAGILFVTFTDIFSENWLVGLGLIGIGVAIVAVIVALKFKN